VDLEDVDEGHATTWSPPKLASMIGRTRSVADKAAGAVDV